VWVLFTFVVFWSYRAHLVTSKWVNQLFASLVFMQSKTGAHWVIMYFYWFPVASYCCSWRERWNKSKRISYTLLDSTTPSDRNQPFNCSCGGWIMPQNPNFCTLTIFMVVSVSKFAYKNWYISVICWSLLWYIIKFTSNVSENSNSSCASSLFTFDVFWLYRAHLATSK